MSPREVFQGAMSLPPHTHESLAEKTSAIAAVAAEDERRRAPTPQLELGEAA
jgi:hypothetical protein